MPSVRVNHGIPIDLSLCQHTADEVTQCPQTGKYAVLCKVVNHTSRYGIALLCDEHLELARRKDVVEAVVSVRPGEDRALVGERVKAVWRASRG